MHGIENEFQQVILNLVNNAKEAFDGQKRADAHIGIDICKDDDKGMIIIKDNAGGISANNIEDIFDIDFTTKENGNGIGLYLVKKIVENRFNGSIEVDNTEYGARFTLNFKLNKEQ